MKRKGARLGQHFLVGTWAAHALACAAGIRKNEMVVEIGPGTGVLTRELLATGGHVVAIEKDELLADTLKATFAENIRDNQLEVVGDDIRNFNPARRGLASSEYVVAANIPYYITGEIIRMFLTTSAQPRSIALLVQKEVAERIVARDKKESILSLSVKAYGVPKVMAKVSRGNFSPVPSVDSAILLIEHVSRDFFQNISEETFFRVIRAGFSSKRKFLLKNLAADHGLEVVKNAFGACDIPEQIRAEDVSLEKWKCLTQQLTEKAKG